MKGCREDGRSILTDVSPGQGCWGVSRWILDYWSAVFMRYIYLGVHGVYSGCMQTTKWSCMQTTYNLLLETCNIGQTGPGIWIWAYITQLHQHLTCTATLYSRVTSTSTMTLDNRHHSREHPVTDYSGVVIVPSTRRAPCVLMTHWTCVRDQVCGDQVHTGDPIMY